MKKIRSQYIAFLIILSLLIGECTQGVLMVKSAPTPINFIPSYQLNMKLLGRTKYDSQDQALYFNYSNSGFEFYYSGTSLNARFITDSLSLKSKDKQAWIGVYLNDSVTPLKKFPLDSKSKSYPIYQSSKSNTVKIRIVKLSEAKHGKSGLEGFEVNSGATISPTSTKTRKIEFIGDSITCGYGINSLSTDSFKTSQENAEETYAAKTARYFNADYNVIASSGIGIYSSVTKTNTRNSSILMPNLYKYTDMLLEQSKKQKPYTPWNSNHFVPDLIIINLGVNDASYVKTSKTRRAEFGKAYYKFIEQVRNSNKNAQIICTIRDNKLFLYEEICTQVQAYSQKNKDQKITTMLLPSTVAMDGFGANAHPNLKTHDKMAKVLQSKISQIMKW